MNEQSVKMAMIAVNSLEDKKANDIHIIDISEISVIGDMFIIAGGTNRNQIQAMCDDLREKLGRAGYEAKQIEGYNNANWVLLDYRDIIIHIFDPDTRSYYDIERIWRDGRRVELEEIKNGLSE